LLVNLQLKHWAKGLLLSLIVLVATTLLVVTDSWAASSNKLDPLTGKASAEEINQLVQQLARQQTHYSRQQLTKLFSQVKFQPKIIELMERPAEKKDWGYYQKLFVTKQRIKGGVTFWRQYKTALSRAEEQYGVPASMIVGIIGVETRYGKIMGSYRVIDALTTLSFYPRRATFFRQQLANFLTLCQQQGFDPLAIKGSYAGAMGYGQFMPGSYLNYAVDFSGQGKVDLINNPVDAIGSIANYLHSHGWQKSQPIVSNARVSKVQFTNAKTIQKSLKPQYTLSQLADKYGWHAKLKLTPGTKATPLTLQGDEGEEHWLGLSNFYVITRYNSSSLYAMAIYQLSEKIKQNYLGKD
jgi:membrane-bound lytic murein transglycosylase B